MEKMELANNIRTLTDAQKFAVLSSVCGDGSPYCNIVGFTISEDMSCLVFATPRKTRKFENILKEPRVSALIDSRSNDSTDFHNAVAVNVMGVASEATGDNRRTYSKLYIDRHPNMEEFINSPDCALIRVAITSYCYVSRFQDVSVLEMKT